jgi:Sec-independent protein translocase protein TatA
MMNGILQALSVGGAEQLVILTAVILLLGFGRNQPNELLRGVTVGMRRFRDAAQDVAREFGAAGFDAGRNLGGIHGNPAFEALTTDNKNVELYRPAVFHDVRQNRTNPQEKMNKFFQPNISRSGRLIRGFGGLAFFGGAFFVFPRIQWAGILVFCIGVFMLFEAWRGWCGLRACGIKTKL